MIDDEGRVMESWDERTEAPVRAIAFYLAQFHPIPNVGGVRVHRVDQRDAGTTEFRRPLSASSAGRHGVLRPARARDAAGRR
jgi:hypothetical protein